MTTPAFTKISKVTIQRIVLALGLSLALHLAIIYGIKVKPGGASSPKRVVIEARLEGAKPLVKPAQARLKASAASKEVTIEEKSVPPLEPAKQSETEPQSIIAPPQKVTADAPEKQSESLLSEQSSGLPALDIPLMEDPTYYPAKQVDEHPAPLQPIDPDYPDDAAASNIEGEVTLLVLIDEMGIVKEVSVVEANPEGYFEESAKAAFRNAQFAPAKRKGREVKSRYLVRVHYEVPDADRKIIQLPREKSD